MHTWKIFWGAALVATSITAMACDGGKASKKSDSASKEEDDEDEDDKKPKKKKNGSMAAGSGEAVAAVSGAAPTPPAPADIKPPPLAAGRSNPPTLEEWNSQLKEVNVKGSSALQCETKIVREYLRVSCRGKNDSGGTPTTLQIRRGGRDAFVFAGGGVTSLVIPYVQGIDAEILFSWTDKSHPLHLTWPRGAPMPTILGVFEGAKSPLDAGGEVAGQANLCKCHKEVTKQTNCDQLFGGYNEFCAATYPSDCQALLECSRGEPSSRPICPPGTVRGGTGHSCYKTCGSDGSCPAGHTCEEVWDAKGCVPN